MVVARACVRVNQGRMALHRAIEVHRQPASVQPGTDRTVIHDSTEVIRLLVLHGADLNEPVLRYFTVALKKRRTRSVIPEKFRPLSSSSDCIP